MKFSVSPSFRRRVAGTVWILGLALALMGIARRPVAQIPALAWAPSVVLSAPEDGTLAEVKAALHAAVAQGEVVARFDVGPLLARNQVLEAELEALGEKENTNVQGQSRRLERDRESASLELAQLMARVAEGEANLGALKERLVVAERLVSEGVSASERAEDVRREIEVAKARVDADRARLSLAERSVARAGRRAAAAPGVNQWQVEAAQRRLEELEGRLNRLTLRSSGEGQVTEIYHAPGEWVEEGEAVLRISPTGTRDVHAWYEANLPPTTIAGSSAQVRRASGERLSAFVASVSAERLPLPEVLWLRADLPQWGYRIRLEITDSELSPGELVQVSLGADAL